MLDAESGETSIILDDLGRVRDVDQLRSGDLILVVEASLSGPPNSEIIRVSPVLG